MTESPAEFVKYAIVPFILILIAWICIRIYLCFGPAKIKEVINEEKSIVDEVKHVEKTIVEC